MKKNYFIILLTVLAIILTGCVSNRISTNAAKKAIENGEWGTPETHTLLFGIAGEDVQATSVLLQQNPDVGYDFLRPYVIENEQYIFGFIKIRNTKFFVYPHPVGSEFKEFLWEREYTRFGQVHHETYYEGVAGVDIKLSKPGLQFYGKDKENHKEELKTLKKMIKYFKGSEWEILINSRIKEISNAK